MKNILRHIRRWFLDTFDPLSNERYSQMKAKREFSKLQVKKKK